MAKYLSITDFALLASPDGTRSEFCPNVVELRDYEDEDAAVFWLEEKNRLGHFYVRFIRSRPTFYFSDPNTAFEFKMRWG